MARNGMWLTPSVKGNYNKKGLSERSGDGLATAVAKFPTPTASRRTGLQSHGVNVVTGALNPTWVEWLMGWPLDSTDLKPLETDKFQQWQFSHGICSEGRSD